jgi:hypothetical protein
MTLRYQYHNTEIRLCLMQALSFAEDTKPSFELDQLIITLREALHWLTDMDNNTSAKNAEQKKMFTNPFPPRIK